jgi:hypothetical protein
MSLIPRVGSIPQAGETHKRNTEEGDPTPSKRARSDSDSEDSNPEGGPSIKWSAYTLHRLKIKKIESTCQSKVEETPYQKVERLLDRVILLQNESSPNFAFSATPPLDAKKLADIQSAGFRIKSFYRTLETTSAFAKFFFPVPEPDKKRSEYLIFFYRVKRKNPEEDKWIYDIFVVATGYSWMAISAFRDPDFSFRLARKIAKPTLYELGARPLFGKKISSSQKWEEFQYGNPLSSYSKWPYNFKTEINSEAVPKGLLPGGTEPREFRLSVGQGSIRLEQGISLMDIPKWFAHFAELLCDKGSLNDNESVAQFFAFLDFLQPVDPALAHTLPFVIKREIWQAMHRPDCKTSLRCIPSLMSDYCRADNVALKGKDLPKTSSVTWSAPQPVTLMIRELSQLACFQELLKNHPHSDRPPKAFCELIDTIILVYSSGSAKPQRVAWMSTLDGEVIERETGQHYFRIAGRWFTLSMDVLFLVHRDFQDLLKSAFLKATNPAVLPKPWTGKDSDSEGRVDVEGIYNNSYLDQERFLVGDKACPRGIELFDLLFFTETDLYLYQVKEEFGHNTRVAGDQVANAAKFVGEAITQNDPGLYSLFLQQQKSYCSQGYERLIQLAGGEDKAPAWLERLFKSYNRENIHFVYAFANKTPSGRKLEDELQLKRRISSEDLKQVIPGIPGHELIASLQEQGFLDRKGFVMSTLLTCSSIKFCAQFKHPAMETQKAKKKLYDKLNEIVMSEYGSTIARMSLIDASRKVRKLGFSFHICQIANQQASSPEEDSYSSFVVVDALEKESSPKFIAGDAISVLDEKFILLPTKHDHSSMLHVLLGQKVGGEFVYIPPEGESPRSIFAQLMKQWSEATEENRDFLEKRVLQLIKPSSEQPFLASSKGFLGYLKKKKISIKKLLKDLDSLKKKHEESRQELLNAAAHLIKNTLSSFDRVKFLQSIYGAQTPVPEAARAIQQVLAGSKEDILKFVLNFNLETWKLFNNKNEYLTNFKEAKATEKEASQKLEEKKNEFGEINILQEYLQALRDPHYPYLLLEVELAALIYEYQIVLLYAEENEIKKQVFNPTASEIKVVFWRGKKDKVPTYFACESASGEMGPASAPVASPSHSLLGTPQKQIAPEIIDLSGSPEKIKVGSDSYWTLETKGHGACLLHAMMGQLKNGIVSWQDNDEQARKKYAEDFEGKMAMQPELLVPFLKLLIEDNPNSQEFRLNQAVWARQAFYQAQLAPLHAQKKLLIERNKLVANQFIEVLTKLCQHLAPTDENIRGLFTAVGPLPDSEKMWKKICHEIRGNIITYFKASAQKYDEFTVALSEVEKVETELQKIEQQFLTLAGQEALWKTYADVIRSSDYWFTESDARILAHLYNKKVDIYARYNSGYEPACETMNKEAANSVVVFFQRTADNRGYHYSQCSKS